MDPTQYRVRELFDYNPETGWLVWKKNTKRWLGKRAGNYMARGYRQVCVDGKLRYEHRIVWIWMFGAISGDIDHINRDRSDNRISNLRPASRSQNLARKPPSNKQGLPSGIYVAHKGKSFSVRIQGDYLGSFPSLQEAVLARRLEAVRRGLLID